MWLFRSRAFLTPSILLILYYVGAILIPIIAYRFALKLQKRLYGGGWIWTGPWNNRLRSALDQSRVIGFGVGLLVAGELLWRIFFEFLFAYFQIHEALQAAVYLGSGT